MHFALPPRKTSQPPPYARAAARSQSNTNRRRFQLLGYIVLGLFGLYLLSHAFSQISPPAVEDEEIAQNPEIVIITVFDPDVMSKKEIQMVKKNRDDYAYRHGYRNFYTNTTTYAHLVDGSPNTWARIPALRHALKLNPTSHFLWSLSANALITNPSLSLESHILHRLEQLMLKDIPVVPPDSVIHTFSHLKPSHAHLILSQDMDNLAHTSFILRNTPPSKTSTDNWAYFLLDAWFDPLYRAYAFQKAENHALEHIVQWHPTILAKLVLIEQRLINSYNFAPQPVLDERTGETRSHNSMWEAGDFVINFQGCHEADERNCTTEMRDYYKKWEREVEKLDGKKGKAVSEKHVDSEKPVVKGAI